MSCRVPYMASTELASENDVAVVSIPPKAMTLLRSCCPSSRHRDESSPILRRDQEMRERTTGWEGESPRQELDGMPRAKMPCCLLINRHVVITATPLPLVCQEYQKSVKLETAEAVAWLQEWHHECKWPFVVDALLFLAPLLVAVQCSKNRPISPSLLHPRGQGHQDLTNDEPEVVMKTASRANHRHGADECGDIRHFHVDSGTNSTRRGPKPDP